MPMILPNGQGKKIIGSVNITAVEPVYVSPVRTPAVFRCYVVNKRHSNATVMEETRGGLLNDALAPRVSITTMNHNTQTFTA